MNDDAVLLRRYADEGSETAFTELVRRHIDLVYGAALRRTGGDPHRAADVAQLVFTALAREARKLSRHAVLGAWLHTATRNAALNLMISEQRRQAREVQALTLNPALAAGDPAPDWDRLKPVLDAAIDELPEADRAAVVLRFLERRPFAEIGVALHVSEDAARMRTDRALDKLRVALAGRGITSTAAALAALVAGQPLVSAPAGLAAALAAQSLAMGNAGPALFGALATIMSTKILATAALSAVVFFALGAYVGVDYTIGQPPLPPPERPAQTEKIASLREQNDRLRAEVDRLTAVNATLSAAHAARPAPAPAAPVARPAAAVPSTAVAARQITILNNLRQLAAARDQFMLENGRPPASLDDLVGETKFIRRLDPIAGEDYSLVLVGRDQPMVVTMADGTNVTYDPVGGTTTHVVVPTPPERIAALAALLGPRVGPSMQRAVAAYAAANNGGLPANPQALLPYFATPQEGADFVEAIEAQKGARP